MLVRFKGNYGTKRSLIKGKVYNCIAQTKSWYRVIDETDEDYLYPKEDFDIVGEQEKLVASKNSGA